ncbi:hypothetical protein Ocin01_19735, partial [Orchesella cincta]
PEIDFRKLHEDGVLQHLLPVKTATGFTHSNVMAVLLIKAGQNNKTIKSSFDRELLREADKWKQVLQRIFKTILSYKEQVSVILRYCTFDETGLTLVVNESFIGFFEILDRSAKGYEALILHILKGLNLSFAMRRGPRLRWSECNEWVKSRTSMSDFFDTIQSVYSFFHSSGLRWKELESIYFEGGSLRKQCESITLKAVCETRWEARHASVFAIKVRYVDILKAIAKIILTQRKERSLRSGWNKKPDRELSIYCNFGILGEHFTIKLQSIEVTLDECVIMWQNGIETLESLKETFAEAKELARKWGVPKLFLLYKNGINRGGFIRKEFLPVIDNVYVKCERASKVPTYL